MKTELLFISTKTFVQNCISKHKYKNYIVASINDKSIKRNLQAQFCVKSKINDCIDTLPNPWTTL